MKIIYDTQDLELTLVPGKSLLDVCLKSKIPISNSCEGMASCGTCRVIITDGLNNLPKRNALELEMANDRGFKDSERLACQLCPTQSLGFVLPDD